MYSLALFKYIMELGGFYVNGGKSVFPVVKTVFKGRVFVLRWGFRGGVLLLSDSI
jgi:hypothetical protein